MSLFRLRSDKEIESALIHGDFIMIWVNLIKLLVCLVFMIIVFMSMVCFLALLI
jgi:hypothetical protein